MSSAKKIKLSSTDPLQNISIYWEKCCICQLNKSEKLIRPFLNKNALAIKDGYHSFSENLKIFHDAGKLPNDINFKTLNANDALETNLIENKAVWHKSCVLKFNTLKAARLTTSKTPAIDPTSEGIVNIDEPIIHITRTTSQSQLSQCVICGKGDLWNQKLHQVSSIDVENKIRMVADDIMLARLGPFNLATQNTKYHKNCLNKILNPLRGDANGTSRETTEGMVFDELVSFIQHKLTDESIEFALKIADLRQQYELRLNDVLQINNPDAFISINTSRLKQKILQHFPNLKVVKIGKENCLLRSEANVLPSIDVSSAMKIVSDIRNEISNTNVSFNNTFDEKSQEKSIPPQLLAIVNMLLYGTPCCDTKQPALTISQLILMNFRENEKSVENLRHKKKHEPPLPVYLGLAIHGRFRSKTMIDEMHRLGLSISSNRVTEITSNLCDLAVKQSEDEGIFCPKNLRKGLFTVGAFDNLDHNLSSTTSKNSFHGTSISVFQIVTQDNKGENRMAPNDTLSKKSFSRSVPELPEKFSVVKHFFLRNEKPSCPLSSKEIFTKLTSLLKLDWTEEEDWLKYIHSTPKIPEALNISWSAFHAENCENTIHKCINSLLPLFEEKSSSIPMVRHGLDIIRAITNFVNPDQIPVMCVDQPLFAIAKTIQWNLPEIYGEKTFVVMFAGFHIEQAFLKLIGEFMDACGWIGIVANSGIVTSAQAEAALKVTMVTKSRILHQKTAAALYTLLRKGYETFLETGGHLSLEDWIDEQKITSPTFKFWFLVLEIEILLLRFVRAIRKGNYNEYKICIKNFLPWFFAFDHVHYSRWLSVHLKDLEELPSTAPEIHEQFGNGHFVIKKTENPFSALAIDQAHEQNNAIVKQDGGAIGLMHEPAALRRWCIAGPEVCRLINEFHPAPDTEKKFLHHEQYTSFQNKFKLDVLALKESFMQCGNPFLEGTANLIAIDSNIVVPNEGVEALYSLQRIGCDMYTSFVQERFVEGSKSVFEPIKKNKIKIFTAQPKEEQSNVRKKKTDEQLFSKMFIASQSRDLDLDNFFSHENQPFPPSLSTDGNLYPGTKSDLATILINLANDVDQSIIPQCDGIIYDGAALMHTISPGNSKTFSDYSESRFKCRLKKDEESYSAKRIDLVWDLYNPESLKNATRESRGRGVRRKLMSSDSKIPTNWQDYLKNRENKKEFFKFLAIYALENLKGIHVVTNVASTIISSKPNESSLDGVEVDHEKSEEADGRLILHLGDMVEKGHEKVTIFSVDTDVLVLAISFYDMFEKKGLRELWVLFGCGHQQQHVPIHVIAKTLGERKSKALLGFHAFTGCDTVSAFVGKGKISCWKNWKSFDEATEAFIYISTPSPPPRKKIFAIFEIFVSNLYSTEKNIKNVNETRKIEFMTNAKPIKSLPPTANALKMHLLRAMYQSGHVWGQAHLPTSNSPPRRDWGWSYHQAVWKPIWMTEPEIWVACRELLKCGCKKGCSSNRCLCFKSDIPCSLMCSNCKGECENNRPAL